MKTKGPGGRLNSIPEIVSPYAPLSHQWGVCGKCAGSVRGAWAREWARECAGSVCVWWRRTVEEVREGRDEVGERMRPPLAWRARGACGRAAPAAGAQHVEEVGGRASSWLLSSWLRAAGAAAWPGRAGRAARRGRHAVSCRKAPRARSSARRPMLTHTHLQ